MSYLIFSDLHLGIYKQHESLGNRFETSCRILEELLLLEVDAYLFCGDLYDVGKNPPAEVVNKVIEIFQRLTKPFIAISGNHDISIDYRGSNPGVTLLSHLDKVIPHFHLIDEKTFQLPDYTVLGVPYRPDFLNGLERLEKVPGRSILLTHQNYPGYVGGQDYSISHVENFDFVFNGHIHSYCTFGKNGYNLGNPYQRDLGDHGQDKGYLILKDGKIKRYLTQYPEVERVKVPRAPTRINAPVSMELKSPVQILTEYCKDPELLQLGLSYL